MAAPDARELIIDDPGTTSRPREWNILNDSRSQYTHDTTQLEEFSPFSMLPNELAMEIWAQVLRQYRIVTIFVMFGGSQSRGPYTASNLLGNIISGNIYELWVTSDHRLSPLLGTNRQARLAALEFYRVHLPHGIDLLSNPYLYLNPEFDFLDLRTYGGTPRNIPDFMHDFKAHDPLNVGVVNLVIGEMGKNILINPSLLAPTTLQSFVSNVTNVKRAYFHQESHADTRDLFYKHNALHTIPFYPLGSIIEHFDLLDNDPRLRDTNLTVVPVGRDPRALLCRWQKMEANFGIQRNHDIEYRYLITAPTVSSHQLGDFLPELSDKGPASRMYRRGETWCGLFKEGNVFTRWKSESPDVSVPSKTAPMAAFGFWLFPVGAFGEMPAGDLKDIVWDKCSTVDLTKYPPQLGLASLPDVCW